MDGQEGACKYAHVRRARQPSRGLRRFRRRTPEESREEGGGGREEAYRYGIGVGCCNATTGLSAVLLGDHLPPPSRTVLGGVVGAAGAGGQGCLLLLVDPRHGSYWMATVTQLVAGGDEYEKKGFVEIHTTRGKKGRRRRGWEMER